MPEKLSDERSNNGGFIFHIKSSILLITKSSNEDLTISDANRKFVICIPSILRKILTRTAGMVQCHTDSDQLSTCSNTHSHRRGDS